MGCCFDWIICCVILLFSCKHYRDVNVFQHIDATQINTSSRKSRTRWDQRMERGNNINGDHKYSVSWMSWPRPAASCAITLSFFFCKGIVFLRYMSYCIRKRKSHLWPQTLFVIIDSEIRCLFLNFVNLSENEKSISSPLASEPRWCLLPRQPF